MTTQLRRGNWGALFYRRQERNTRGVTVWGPDFERRPFITRMKYYVLRSARAEIPGQQTNEQAYLIIPATSEAASFSAIIISLPKRMRFTKNIRVKETR